MLLKNAGQKTGKLIYANHFGAQCFVAEKGKGAAMCDSRPGAAYGCVGTQSGISLNAIFTSQPPFPFPVPRHSAFALLDPPQTTDSHLCTVASRLK